MLEIKKYFEIDHKNKILVKENGINKNFNPLLAKEEFLKKKDNLEVRNENMNKLLEKRDVQIVALTK